MKKIIFLLTILIISLHSCNYKHKKAEREAEQDVVKSTLIKVGQTIPEFTYITLKNIFLTIV